MQLAKHDIIQQLQREALSMQRHKGISGQRLHKGLGDIDNAFPEHTFPLGAVHEFISANKENAAATNGFMAGLVGQLMQKSKLALWISAKRTIYPPALKMFGIAPERIVFVDLCKQKEVLWAIEEALKCNVLSVVIGELSELSFTESRRLQLAVEQSRVTGLIHRYTPRTENTVACVTRWKIAHLASETNGLPGVGFPKWNVELLKVRNGRPGTWQIEWSKGGFKEITPQTYSISENLTRKTG